MESIKNKQRAIAPRPSTRAEPLAATTTSAVTTTIITTISRSTTR